MSRTSFSVPWLVLGVAPLVVGCGTGVGPTSFTAQEIADARARVNLELPKRPIAQLVQRPLLPEITISETAADSLSRIGSQALPVLIAALHDSDPVVRTNAAKGIARLGETAQQAVPALTAALADDVYTVRLTAARALGQIGPGAAPAIPELSAALRDTESRSRAMPPAPGAPVLTAP
ncbi:MAG: HEAT repeat domain-containing protein [Pirellulales bacterium]|nr:HEAT repeat domain-containing protein [Pirellulales bacterium]